MISEEIHPDSIEVKAQEIRELVINITEVEEPDAEIVTEDMINWLARRLRESGQAAEIARYLYKQAPNHVETQPGHLYGVYTPMSQEKGLGRLFAVQIILANPHLKLDQVNLHDHPMPETTLLIEGEQGSVMEVNGERTIVKIQRLVPHKMPPRISHGVVNLGQNPTLSFCIRRDMGGVGHNTK